MSVLDAALDIFENVDISEIRLKSVRLNEFFQSCIQKLTDNYSGSSAGQNPLILACNNNAEKRASQISFSHPYAYAICQALIQDGVIADFRAPNILRIGFSPLFLSFTDIVNAAHILIDIIRTNRYSQTQFQVKNSVT
jgi:kynureninase